MQHQPWWFWVIFFFACSSTIDAFLMVGSRDDLRNYRAMICALLIALTVYFGVQP